MVYYYYYYYYYYEKHGAVRTNAAFNTCTWEQSEWNEKKKRRMNTERRNGTERSVAAQNTNTQKAYLINLACLLYTSVAEVYGLSNLRGDPGTDFWVPTVDELPNKIYTCSYKLLTRYFICVVMYNQKQTYLYKMTSKGILKFF